MMKFPKIPIEDRIRNWNEICKHMDMDIESKTTASFDADSVKEQKNKNCS
jgi:hypothetical protein